MTRAIRRALISVFDKTGIVEFCRALHEEFGIELISTGGTAAALREAGLAVTLVEEITQTPEMLDGRVKTLHPRIHGGILADRSNPEHMKQLASLGISPIDMVVVNLYPFADAISRPGCSLAEAIELIDIGGPCMLRAAAKNHRHVAPVLYDPARADDVLRQLREAPEELYSSTNASSCFQYTSHYDQCVQRYLACIDADGPVADARMVTEWSPVAELRYGENPHQFASLYRPVVGSGWGVPGARVLSHGEAPAMSYNNYVDADAALSLACELPSHRPACVFVKHTNACGVGVADELVEAYRRAYLGDCNAAMGGILAMNRPVSRDVAEAVMGTMDRWGREAGAGAFFVEVWIAPSFDDDAVAFVHAAKAWGQRVRMLAVGQVGGGVPREAVMKQIMGGGLLQTTDDVGLNESDWRVVSKRGPTAAEWSDLRLAWLVCKHTKSNAITLCKDGMLIGNGAGQMSRVMSCRIACWAARDNGHEARLAGAVAASDAFFPFRDGPDFLMDAGVAAIIQPGGSKRDDETVAACDERGVALVMTGTRHFLH